MEGFWTPKGLETREASDRGGIVLGTLRSRPGERPFNRITVKVK